MSVFLSPPSAGFKGEDLAGRTFGYWTVLRFLGRDSESRAHWECRCTCGKVRTIRGEALRRGQTTNCGCERKALERERLLEHAPELPQGAYLNGTPAYDASAVVDQPSTRKKLADLARQLRPGEDPIESSLRPESLRFDSLARACAILALRYPAEDQLYDLRFALERARLPELAEYVWDAARGQADPSQLNEVRRLLAEALSK